MIYFDARTNTYVKNLKTDYLAPELYFEVGESDDDAEHYFFMMKDGTVIEISMSCAKDFAEKIETMKDRILHIKKVLIPKSRFQAICKEI